MPRLKGHCPGGLVIHQLNLSVRMVVFTVSKYWEAADTIQGQLMAVTSLIVADNLVNLVD